MAADCHPTAPDGRLITSLFSQDLERSEDELAHYQKRLSVVTEALDEKTEELDTLTVAHINSSRQHKEYREWAEEQVPSRPISPRPRRHLARSPLDLAASPSHLR